MLEFLKDLVVGTAIITLLMSWMLLVYYLAAIIIAGGWIVALPVFLLICVCVAYIIGKVHQCE